jgi:hypothetical protein
LHYFHKKIKNYQKPKNPKKNIFRGFFMCFFLVGFLLPTLGPGGPGGSGGGLVEDWAACVKSLAVSSRESWAYRLTDGSAASYWQSCGAQVCSTQC